MSTLPQSKSSTTSKVTASNVHSSSRSRESTSRSPGGNNSHVTKSPANPNTASNAAAARSTSQVDVITEMKGMFAELTTQMNARFDAIGEVINLIKSDLAEAKRSVVDLEVAVNSNAEKIQAIDKESMPRLKQELERKNEELEEKIMLLELHQRKQNLLIYGVAERNNENIIAVVHEVLSFFLKIPTAEASKILLVNAHRLPAPQHDIGNEAKIRPIIIRFVNMSDRDRLLNAFEGTRRQRPSGSARNTPSTTEQQTSNDREPRQQPAGVGQQLEARYQSFTRVTIRTDLPPQMKRERGKLAAEAYKLRKEQKLSTRIRINGIKLYLQTRKPTTDGSQASWKNWVN